MQVEISEDGFIHMLLQQNGGALVEELDREMIKGIDGIFDIGGASKITLQFKLTKVSNLEKAINILPNLVCVHPREPYPAKCMFATDGHGLTDQFQQQEKMDLGMPVNSKPASLSPVSSITKGTS